MSQESEPEILESIIPYSRLSISEPVMSEPDLSSVPYSGKNVYDLEYVKSASIYIITVLFALFVLIAYPIATIVIGNEMSNTTDKEKLHSKILLWGGFAALLIGLAKCVQYIAILYKAYQSQH